MGRSRKKARNAATTSEQPPTEKKAPKHLRAGAKKIKKKSSKTNVTESDNINTTEGIKNVKDNGIKDSMNGGTQGNVQIEASIKETEAIKEETKQIEAVTKETGAISKETKQTEAITKETEPITTEPIGGYIFLCNTRTKPDCFNYKVMGLPENRREFVFRIKPGMKLFLYDFDLKLLYGIFKASSFGGMMLERAAFNGCYPAQVRFEVDSARAPLHYQVFKHAIKDNFTGTRNMFKTELSVEQVKELTKLFSSSSQQQVIMGTNTPMLQPAPVSAPGPRPVLAPAQAPTPFPASVRAPTLMRTAGAAPPPVVMSRPANHPQASIHSRPFGSSIRNHPSSSQIEIAQPPVGVMLHNPRSATQNPFMVPVTRSAPGPFPQTYQQILPGSLAPQPAPRFMVPYDSPRMGAFGEGPYSVEPALGVWHLTHATDVPAAYNIRNEQRVGNADHLGPPPVSSRYAFAGPTILYKGGFP